MDMKKHKVVLAVCLLLCFAAGTLGAEDLEQAVALHQQSLDMIWLLLAAALVFFMQAGFAMVEIGLTRAKNSGNIIMKNLMDFSVGALFYWAIGWALMYGTSYAGLFGFSQFFITDADPVLFRDWMFQVVFAATAATIVSGAMAERTKFSAYLIYSIVISAIIYPISGTLDLGRWLAWFSRLPRLCRFHSSSLSGWMGCLDGLFSIGTKNR